MKSVKFQYLLVRLKDETEKGLKALIAEFQYLLVRLKGRMPLHAFNKKCISIPLGTIKRMMYS